MPSTSTLLTKRNIILLTILILLSGGGIYGAMRLTGDGPSTKPSNGSLFDPSPDPNAQVAQVLFFDVTSIDPATRSITGTVQYQLTNAAKRALTDSSSTKIASDCYDNKTPSTCKINSGQASKIITVYVQAYSTTKPTGGPSDYSYYDTQTLTLGDLYAAERADQVTTLGTVTLTADVGHPAAYPNDYYRMRVLLTAQSQDVDLSTFATCRVYSTEQLSDLDVAVNRSLTPVPRGERACPSAAPNAQLTGAIYNVTRPGRSQIFAYAVGVGLPSLLILLVIGLVVLSAERRVSVGFKDFVAEFGVVAFTLLLVRPLVVPDSLNILTRIDYMLSAEVTLMVAFTVFYFVVIRTPGEPIMANGTKDSGEPAVAEERS